jgi:hypothetical protein
MAVMHSPHVLLAVQCPEAVSFVPESVLLGMVMVQFAPGER